MQRLRKILYKKMGGSDGENANYFRFRVRDVVRSHDHKTRRDWLQQENIMLITLQVCTSLCRFLQTFASFCNIFIAGMIFILFYMCRRLKEDDLHGTL